MAINVVEFISGPNIRLDPNIVTNSITIDTTVPIPTSSNPLGLDKGGTGRTDLTAEDIEKLKRMDEKISEYIKILAKPILITQSGQFNIPVTGKWEIRLCGGGGSGYCPTVGYWGAGGNSGYLKTVELQLTEGTVLNISIGAGGRGVAFGQPWPNNGKGGNTTVVINSQQYVAKGGLSNSIRGDGSNVPVVGIDIPYDGREGSANGGISIVSTGVTHTVIPSDGAMNGGRSTLNKYNEDGTLVIVPLAYHAGGGGGGVIAGNIAAGKGQTLVPALGYGAGGGGGVNSSGHPVVPGGDGAPGAVQLTFFGV